MSFPSMHQQSLVHRSPVLAYKVLEHLRLLLVHLLHPLRAPASFSPRRYGRFKFWHRIHNKVTEYLKFCTDVRNFGTEVGHRRSYFGHRR